MKQTKYRKKLRKWLGNYFKSAGTCNTYASGSNNKKPNGDVRYAALQELGHPFYAWGDKLNAYILEVEEQEKNKNDSEQQPRGI